MSLRTNPDRILDNIDRQKLREEENQSNQNRQAIGRALNTEPPDLDATTPERTKRLFRIVEEAYTSAASNTELGRLASHFRAVGDIPHHHARGDVSISVQYIDSPRLDDIGMAPYEIRPQRLLDAKKETKTSRPDVNALKVLRLEIRNGVMTAYKKLTPRIKDALRDRADMGDVEVQVTMDVRSAASASGSTTPEGGGLGDLMGLIQEE
ncbi:uncharacterized protein METZ01_LOCUS185777 [marine metagenome]|uniref:Uncharacterized protein n=1 Tax=marine metagenome TaxID=408172 RepID=A0A382D5T7_9ZZZZ